MSSEIEAAGAAVMAGVAARVLEGKSGSEVVHGPCANCGAEVYGRFCAACGQPGHVHRTLGHFIEEALHGVFHFDTKAWRTLPMLVVRPGTLTRRYTMGERSRFISPVALFLFTVFLMFFVFALLGEQGPPPGRPTIEQLRQTEAGALAAQTAVAERVRRRLAEIEARSGDLSRARDQLTANLSDARERNDAEAIQSIEFSLSRIEAALADPAGPQEGITTVIGPDGGVSTTFSGQGATSETIFQQIREANARGEIQLNFPVESWNKKISQKLENPELAWYKIQNSAYKFSFLLIPISLPFVWLIFAWKRGTTLFDHSVFVLYSLSFVSLLLIVLLVLQRAWPWGAMNFGPWMMLAVPVHMFFQLKGGYRLGWFSALWRAGYLYLASALCLSLFLLAILLLGLLG